MDLYTLFLDRNLENSEISKKKIAVFFNDLSVRSKNILNYYLEFDHSIESYNNKIFLNPKFNVSKLRNCGNKSRIELLNYLNLISDNENSIITLPIIQKESFFKILCLELNDSKELKIDTYIKIIFKNLTVRAQNALKNTLEEINFENIKENILFREDFEVNKIRNIGKGTIDTVEKFITQIKEHIIQISQNEIEINKEDLKLKISIESLLDQLYIDEILIKNRNHLQIIDFIINSDKFFNKKEKMIFKSNLNFVLGEEKLSLFDLQKPLKLKKERIRQIRVEFLSSISERFNFIRLFNQEFLRFYHIELEYTYISLSNDQTDKINKFYNVNFTEQFHTFILSYILNNSFSLIGHIVDVVTIFERVNDLSRHNWKHLYLIKTELKSTFDFTSFVNDVYLKINENSSEGYKFHMKSYMSNFLKTEDYRVLNKLLPICEEILEKEFNIILDVEDCIVFERTKAKSIAEYTEEALEKIGKPSHVLEITNCIKDMYPDFTKEVSGVNLKNRSIFTYFGRSSIYGLVKWENEKENIKGGTIKDFVIEYLKKKETPIHIFELYDEIIKYRNETYIRSIIDNLKAKSSRKNFIFYPVGFVGLKELEDQYDTKYNKIPLMLTKTIIGKISKNIFKSRDDIEYFLHQNYKLTITEAINYINYLELTSTLPFK